ncbi:hypothetical protein F511_17099 [Dorcoceras hygrometricum]|uniref:Uncharacterized protein n=1 Tax=Dorcoceras hygrometricum TaxID=472368 RepID=A0A2Z7B054_9LAMI|nr:hypothetical protein F511_17099 [Dorcoceras hygrometricum]
MSSRSCGLRDRVIVERLLSSKSFSATFRGGRRGDAAVDRQSGPRLESRHLHHPALEGLTNSARIETPQRGGRNKSGKEAAARGWPTGGAWVGREERWAAVLRTNQYNQDLRLIHSTNGNHLESPNEGSSIDHQVTIHLHAQNITMFPTNETLYFASQMLVSSSGGLILILTAQSTRNEFRMHSDY